MSTSFSILGGGGPGESAGPQTKTTTNTVPYAIAVVAHARRAGHLIPRCVEGGVADAVEPVRESGYPGLVPIAQQPGTARVGEQKVEAGISPPLLSKCWGFIGGVRLWGSGPTSACGSGLPSHKSNPEKNAVSAKIFPTRKNIFEQQKDIPAA